MAYDKKYQQYFSDSPKRFMGSQIFLELTDEVIPAGQILVFVSDRGGFFMFQTLSDVNRGTADNSLVGYEAGSVLAKGKGGLLEEARIIPPFKFKLLRLPTRVDLSRYVQKATV